MANRKRVEVIRDDHSDPHKWFISLQEDVFKKFLSQGGSTVQKIFGDGSLFSPLLFGKFFDPSDAFPLWEFESDILLSNLRSSGQSTVDWSKTDHDYVLKAEATGIGKNSVVQVLAEGEKVVEVSGLWRQQQKESKTDWKSVNWWEYGYVRRLELPEDADLRKLEAYVTNDTLLEIKIPKKPLDCENDLTTKGSEAV